MVSILGYKVMFIKGPSGSGKSYLANYLSKSYGPETHHLVVDTVTRKPRPNDIADNFAYVTKEEYDSFNDKLFVNHYDKNGYCYRIKHFHPEKVNIVIINLEEECYYQPTLLLLPIWHLNVQNLIDSGREGRIKRALREHEKANLWQQENMVLLKFERKEDLIPEFKKIKTPFL